MPGKASMNNSAYGKGMVLLGRQKFFLLQVVGLVGYESTWILQSIEAVSSYCLGAWVWAKLHRRRQNQRHLASPSVPPLGRSHWGTGVALWASSIWRSVLGSYMRLKAGRGIWRASPMLQWNKSSFHVLHHHFNYFLHTKYSLKSTSEIFFSSKICAYFN